MSSGKGAVPGCILVVDDSVTLRTLLRDLFVDQGYRVLEAADGAEATRIYRQHEREIDAVLLDEEMPVMGGHEALRVLLTINPGVRVLCMSGGDGALRTAGGGDIGFQGFVQKPFRIADLLSRVERLVGAAGRR